MISRIVLVLWITGLADITVYAASFDCEKAKSEVERTVCRYGDLSDLDEDLGYQYRTATSPSRAELKREQTAWLVRRDSCGADRDCLRAAYTERLRELEARKDRATKGMKHASLLIGTYDAYAINICFPGGSDDNGNREEECHTHRNALSIVAVDGDKLEVEFLDWLGPAGGECLFKGVGVVKGFVLLAVDPSIPNCPVELTYRSGRLSLRRDEECGPNKCGLRVVVDGTVLYKRP